MSSLSSSIDLHRVLGAQVGLSLVASAGLAPVYNLPIFLYGWSTLANDAGAEPVRQFLSILVTSFVLDIIWLYSWGAQTSTIPYLLILATFCLKPVTLLAGLGNLRQRGASTFGDGFGGGFGGGAGGGEPVWSMPNNNAGGFPSGIVPPGPSAHSHQAQPIPSNQNSYQAFDEDAQDIRDVEARVGNGGLSRPSVPVVSGAVGGGGGGGVKEQQGYHSLE